jgi:hypothetical protein
MDHGKSKFISEDRSELRGQLNCLNHGAPLSLSAGFSFRCGESLELAPEDYSPWC